MAFKEMKLDATETPRFGMRQFRENFATILNGFDGPVAITRHGDTVGYYIPARPRRSEDSKVALTQAVAKLHEVLAAHGISSEELMEEFKRVKADHEDSERAQAEQEE
jgi:hypothetical protein